MSNRFNFTKAALDELPPAAPGKRDRYFDAGGRSSVPGLTLRVSSSGRVFYYYKKALGRVVQQKLGPFPDISIETARAMAAELNGKVARKEDPVASARRPRNEKTFGELGEWWMVYARANKRSAWLDELFLEQHFAIWKHRHLGSITREAAEDLHAQLTKRRGPTIANRAMETARAMFNRAIRKGVFEGRNPIEGVEWNRTKSRGRRLMPGEVKAFLEAVEAEPNEQFRDYVMLSLFTGARRGNVRAMRWDQIDFVGQIWTIPGDASKNGETLTIPLGEDELAILQRRKQTATTPWVFPSKRSKDGHMIRNQAAWDEIVKRAGLDDLHLHDLRRTLGSFMADTGSSLHVIGESLGHTSAWVTHVYARLALGSVREGKGRAVQAIKKARGGPEAPKPAVPTARSRRRAAVRQVRAEGQTG